jgi:hypothetical protein
MALERDDTMTTAALSRVKMMSAWDFVIGL